MQVKIALAGNPNSGKTTLFNALTGANQFVGNWPGVTVEKKEGKLKGDRDVVITDLPGIYSLSPYTLEEVVARNYLLDESPDAILNIVDGSNLERNLYLTTQLCELGIPVVMAINMMDVVEKNGDTINLKELGKIMGCEVVAASALKGRGVQEAAGKAVAAAKMQKSFAPAHHFSEETEGYLSEIETKLDGLVPESQKRFYAIKLFENDDKIIGKIKHVPDVSDVIQRAEDAFEDDAESIITNERYGYITSLIQKCYIKKNKNRLTPSDKIDKVVTNRFAALPIFALIMFLVYYVSVTTVGTWATDWANDGVFGDGWHLFGVGTAAYEEQAEEYSGATAVIDAFMGDDADEGYTDEDLDALVARTAQDAGITYETEDEETLAVEEETASYDDLVAAVETYKANGGEEPDPANYGIWVPGIPVLMEGVLDKIGCADWLKGLILNGIVAGVGSVLGFLPQIFVLFIFLAFLEACGYRLVLRLSWTVSSADSDFRANPLFRF